MGGLKKQPWSLLFWPPFSNQWTREPMNLPTVTVFTFCDIGFSHIVTLMFFYCDNSWYHRQTYRQTSYCSLYLSYCNVSSRHLWHRFLFIVIFSFLCDNSFYRLMNRMAQRQTHYVSLHLTYCDICCYPLWHWFLHIVV